jgi:hypothetical protein
LRSSTKPETFCTGTKKLACRQVQLAPARTMVHTGVGSASASNEGVVLWDNISHSLAKMVPFVLAGDLCRLPVAKA